MMVGFDCGRMIAIFPRGSISLFSLVELLSCPACNQLHRLGDCFTPAVKRQQMVFRLAGERNDQIIWFEVAT
jgi:hypothetical protein